MFVSVCVCAFVMIKRVYPRIENNLKEKDSAAFLCVVTTTSKGMLINLYVVPLVALSPSLSPSPSLSLTMLVHRAHIPTDCGLEREPQNQLPLTLAALEMIIGCRIPFLE